MCLPRRRSRPGRPACGADADAVGASRRAARGAAARRSGGADASNGAASRSSPDGTGEVSRPSARSEMRRAPVRATRAATPYPVVLVIVELSESFLASRRPDGGGCGATVGSTGPTDAAPSTDCWRDCW